MDLALYFSHASDLGEYSFVYSRVRLPPIPLDEITPLSSFSLICF